MTYFARKESQYDLGNYGAGLLNAFIVPNAGGAALPASISPALLITAPSVVTQRADVFEFRRHYTN